MIPKNTPCPHCSGNSWGANNCPWCGGSGRDVVEFEEEDGTSAARGIITALFLTVALGVIGYGIIVLLPIAGAWFDAWVSGL
jgi:hypothetical protein